MSQPTTTWQGASKIVDAPKAIRFGAWYVAEYRIRQMLHWIQAIIAFGLGNPILYLTSVGIGIGSLVDKNLGAAGIEGVNYLTFLAPALLAAAAIQSASEELMFPVMEGFVWRKTFWAMNATQISGRSIFYGLMIAAAARSLLTTIIYELILLAFGAITLQSIPALTFSAFFAGMAFAAAMGAASAYVKEDDGFFALVGRFVIAPMFMFSGTFYPLDSLPSFLQWIGWISPLWHSTDIGRALSYGRPVELWLMIVHFAVLAIMLVVGTEIGARQFSRRLAK
jgi:lipooligosaccharide transport system permease protein